MRRLDEHPIDPQIAASLDAIDATLAGDPVDPQYAELAEVALLLAADRPEVDPAFARVAGSAFGGLDLRPLPIVGLLWSKIIRYIGTGSAQMFRDFLSGKTDRPAEWIGDLGAWHRGWSRSLREDPLWHASWLADVARKSARLQATLWTSSNPRVSGPNSDHCKNAMTLLEDTK